jgi:Glycosyltransferase family 87
VRDATLTRIGRRALIAVYIGLAIGFALQILRTLTTPGALLATDFTVFWTGWSLLLHGPASALYDAAAQRATQQSLMGGMRFQGGLMAFLNPPHAALAGVPFGWLADHAGERVAFLVWTGGNLALLAILDRYLRDEWGSAVRGREWVLTCALLAFYPVFCAVNNGQTSIVLAVAVLGVYRATERSRAWTAGAWLSVLSIKPQLLPLVLIYLAARRCWRAIACGILMSAIVAALTTVALGPSIWLDYLTQVRHLEQFWGTGTPAYMLNVRGALTRMIGIGEQESIDAIAYAVWVLAMVLVAVVLVHRRVDRQGDARSAYAFVVAVALLTNPHLFVQDAVIWAIPLVLHAAAIRDASDESLFAQFALSWPVVFAASRLLDAGSGRQAMALVPQMCVLTAAPLLIWRGWPTAYDQPNSFKPSIVLE